jgi:hypothetical protein
MAKADKDLRAQYDAALKAEREAHARLQELSAQKSMRGHAPDLVGQITKAKMDWDGKRARLVVLKGKLGPR